MVLLSIILLLLAGCSKSEVLMELPQTKSIDTTYTPRVRVDTMDKHPIRFDVNIIDLEDADV